MNIFITDLNPIVAAQNLCDIHIPKMLLESTQMLSNAFHLNNPNLAPCAKSMIKHPCSVWALESRQNFSWLLSHTIEINNEYTKRFNKIHSYDPKIEFISKNHKSLSFEKHDLTPHVQVMPKIYHGQNVVSAYRSYYVAEKNFAKWRHGTQAPDWYTNAFNQSNV